MKSAIRKLGLAAGLIGGMVGMTAGVAPLPASADGQGATTVDCSLFFPNVQGVIVINQNGILVNCFEHVQGDGGPPEVRGSRAEVVDCTEALGFEAYGIAVITPSGNVLVNCHPHFLTHPQQG